MFELIKKIFEKYLILAVIIFSLLVSLTHFIFSFLIPINYFNSSDMFASSPLFDFSIDNCKDKSIIVFHRYGGRKDYEWTLNGMNYLKKKK